MSSSSKMMVDGSSLVTPAGMIAAIRNKVQVPLLSAITFVAIACIYLWIATPLYEARVTIVARSAQANPLSQIGKMGMGLLGGLGKGMELTDYDKLIDVLMSRDTASAILADEELMRSLFPDAWDPQKRMWRQPSGIAGTIRSGINRLFGLPEWTQPADEPVLGLLEERLRIVRNESDTSHTIFLYARDQQVAVKVLRLTLNSADGLLRNRARETNATNVDFLRKQLATEPLIEVRAELSRQLGEELSKSAMLGSTVSYSYEVLKSMRVSSRPVSPRPLLTLLIATVAGLFVGVAFVILRTSDWQRARRESVAGSQARRS